MRTLARILATAAVLIGAGAMTRQDAPVAPVPAVHANDRVMGRDDAPVTVIEYASFTCHVCGDWHALVWPEFKRRFIDTGRVRMVIRNMPTPPAELSIPAAALARCAAPERFFDTADALFDGQPAILRGGDQGAWFDAAVAASGRTRAQIDTCVARPEIKTFLEAEIAAGAAAGATTTPAFFVNGRRVHDRSLGGLEIAIRTAEEGR
ncbi:MAG: thioredoxin domain-containing protein [Brevundimonas sp.]|uniref:thioredoxin domain-containing protein n=1 Tax=Brevundimonas sp. TaxID=1871086 RepID=UPI0025C380E8|nr:thioredoxin domain-containing protein [Brevundimonas sp.]MBX3477585.1 thioredoxin domain-containing protein [Brevundimonas sp.]